MNRHQLHDATPPVLCVCCGPDSVAALIYKQCASPTLQISMCTLYIPIFIPISGVVLYQTLLLVVSYYFDVQIQHSLFSFREGY